MFCAGVEAKMAELATTMASVSVDAECEESFIHFSLMADQHILRGWFAKRTAAQIESLLRWS
jgi:hypothetical protein